MNTDQATPCPDEGAPPERSAHRLRRGILFGLLFATPFWIGLAYTVWRLL